MFLSRVRVDLNGLSRELLFEVMGGGAYGAHQLLWRLFPDHTGARPFLFRQEMEEPGGPDQSPKGLPLFYVLSDREPVAETGLLEVQSKPFAPVVETGDQLAFRLRANPTVAKAAEGRGRRADVLMAAKFPYESGDARTSRACVEAMDNAAHNWLSSRAESWGFRLPVKPNVGAYRQHALHKPGRRDAIRFSSVDYEGLLEVTDPERLVETLAHGIGHAKAFGCGLLMLRRP